MKSLWMVNKCCGAYHEKIYGKKATGGQWLDAMLDEARCHDEDSVVVVNVEKKPRMTYFEDGNISYYTIKGQPNEKYNYKSKRAVNDWKVIIEKEKPDIIEIWGTEFPYALAALGAAKDIPCVIYVQGILDSIAKYYISGLSKKELKNAVTIRDIFTGRTISQTQYRYEKRSCYERKIANMSGHIIIENNWARAYYAKMCPGVKAHYLPFSISNSFREHSWSEDIMKPHTIMCPAANYPIKGLHMLLKALAIVKTEYPDVNLFVPGTVPKPANSLTGKLKELGYDRLIKKLIKDLDLSENVIYTGRLTADEMAEKMSEVNCFTMTSAIENHSSTLKEAMTVGVPCVASYVGGVPQYAEDEENCLLYRFEDYEVLAQNICRIFADKELRVKLSETASSKMKQPKDKTDYEQMREIFKTVIQAE